MNPYSHSGGLFDGLQNMFGQMGGASAYQMGLQNDPQSGRLLQQQAQAQQNWALGGFMKTWNFAEEPKPAEPEQYGPWPPPIREWRYETSYAAGRENVWLPPLRDPGGRLLKVAAILAVYPAAYLTVLLVRGLLYAIF